MTNVIYSVIDFVLEKVADFREYEPSSSSYPLHEAVEKEDIIRIFKLLKIVPVDCIRWGGETALFHATSKPPTSKTRRIVKILLKKGADPLKTYLYSSPAYNVFKQNDMDLMMTLLKYIPDVNHPVFFDKKLLDTAVENRNTKMVQTLLDLGADFMKADLREISYLHEAVFSMEPTLIDVFLKAGVDINCRDHMWRTPLHYAASGLSHSCLRKLLANKPDLNPLDKTNSTPLNLAIRENEHFCEEKLALMLDSKCDPNIPDMYGCTPLHNLIFAAINASIDKIKLLVRAGVDINARNGMGKTPLHLALEMLNDRLARYLVMIGADLSIKDLNNMTPFHLAVHNAVPFAINLMIRHMTMLKRIRHQEMPEDDVEVIRSNIDLYMKQQDCEDEITRLEYRLGDSNLRAAECYFNKRKIVEYARNVRVRDAIHTFKHGHFRNYGMDIMCNLKYGLYRRYMEDIAEECYTEIFGEVLPYNCITNIVRFLSDDDLAALKNHVMGRRSRTATLERAQLLFRIGFVTLQVILRLDGLTRSLDY